MISDNRSRKVLVVDDEPLVRQTLAYVLRDEYEVVGVSSGEEALEASAREPFPVVILDLCMEGLSGIETLQRLRKIREGQNVIILTAYQSTETAISALNLGAFNYLTKPFERNHLKRIIAQGFDLYEAQSARTEDMRHRLMGVHDTFFSLLCHEFNTPLNIILGFAELLKRGRNEPDYDFWVEHIYQSGTYLHDILMEIVDYAAASHLAEAGIEKPFVADVLLRPLIEAFSKKDIVLEIQNESVERRELIGPSDAILSIARKLVRTATHRSKNIRISTSIENQDGPHLKIVVSGTRIFEGREGGNELEKLFEPYQFISKDDSSSSLSVGLELATCRKIADYAHSSVYGVFDPRGELELVARFPVQIAG